MKFDFTKEYIKKFLLNFSSPDFNGFALKSIRDKTTTEPTSRIISTREKYLKALNPVTMYIDFRTFIRYKRLYIPPSLCVTSQILIQSDLYLRVNKSFLRAITEIGYSEPTDKVIEELTKELNDNQMNLSKLYCFKNKSTIILTVKFKKEDFILPTAFPWTNQVLLSDTDAPNNLKTIFDSTKTILEKANKVSAPENIRASVNTQIEKN